ncbi:MAG: hypothetical protein ACOYON_11275 [Fimbriimonas sp.]
MSSRILVRFNTKFTEDPEGRTWRVLVDGVETLAHKVMIDTPTETITESISTGEVKHHILCHGRVEWDEASNAHILA